MRLPDALTRRLGHVERYSERGARRLASLARTLRFLRELSHHQPRASDVFIASYPRSGTTWLQLMTHLVVRGGAFDFAHISDVAPWFERSLSLGRMSGADFEALPDPRVFKTHLPFRWLPRVGRVVYVERSVADVAVSYYELYRSHLGFQGSWSDFFAQFMAGRVQYGSWFDHVAEWRTQRTNPRILFLRYEQMLAEPVATVSTLAAFLGISRSPQEIARVAALCDFSVMKREEQRFDHASEELRYFGMQSGRFVRQGHAGAGERVLSDAQRRVLDARGRAAGFRAPRLVDLPAFLH